MLDYAQNLPEGAVGVSDYDELEIELAELTLTGELETLPRYPLPRLEDALNATREVAPALPALLWHWLQQVNHATHKPIDWDALAAAVRRPVYISRSVSWLDPRCSGGHVEVAVAPCGRGHPFSVSPIDEIAVEALCRDIIEGRNDPVLVLDTLKRIVGICNGCRPDWYLKQLKGEKK
jgi:hypothetical protein